MTAPYPWQREQWERLWRAGSDGRLAHALLLVAPEGTGLRAFAEHWSRSRLCRNAGAGGPCGRCPDCEQIEAGTHPDFVRVLPEEAGKAIGVDAVRAMIERLGLTAGERGKIALVDPADALTLQAANSLLKTLEEPPGGSVIVLLSTRPSRLPATVRSRCRRIAFGLPPRDTALAWLREQGVETPETWLARAAGAPLTARALARDADDEEPVVEALLQTLERGVVAPELAARLSDRPLAASVPLLATVITDLIRIRVAGDVARDLHHPAQRERLERVAARLDALALFHYLDELNRAVPGPSSALRPDMQIEGLLADATAVRRAARSNGGL